MEILRSSLPHTSLPFPLVLLEKEFFIVAILLGIFFVYLLYLAWKKMEVAPGEFLANTGLSQRKFRGTLLHDDSSKSNSLYQKILALDPQKESFCDEVMPILLKYIELALSIQISPTHTASEIQKLLPRAFHKVIIDIRDIRYAKKGELFEKQSDIKKNILACMKHYGIR